MRDHPETPHFFKKRPVRAPFDADHHESAEHAESCRIFSLFLEKHRRLDAGYYESPWLDDPGFEQLARTSDYQWTKKGRMGLVYGRLFIPDLLGRAREVNLEDKNPFIAVEVVDTHFPSLDTFKALLECTKNLPLIVAFYYCKHAPRVNHMKKPLRDGAYARVRVTHYLADGSFWERNERLEEKARISPERHDEYYNYIVEYVYREWLVRRDGD